MADKTLNDVIERLKAEGQLTRNGHNSIKSVKEILKAMQDRDEESAKDESERGQQLADIKQALIDNDEEAVEAVTKSDDNLTTGDDVELLREEVKREMEVINLLREIRDNTAGMGGVGKPEKEKKEKSESTPLVDIGLGAIIAGGTAGVLGGLVQGYVKALDALIPGFEKLRKLVPKVFKQYLMLVPNIIKGVYFAIKGLGTAFTSALRVGMQGLAKLVPNQILAVGKAVGGFFGGIVKFFAVTIGKIFRVPQIIESIQKGFQSLISIPTQISKFVKAGAGSGNKVIKFISDGIKTLSDFFKAAGGVFKAVASTVSKIFTPILVVMSVFDFVGGFIEGFQQKEGNMMQKILAGFVGGIKGLLNGLIAVPLDMLKNGIAWIMEKIGIAPETTEAIRGFSFSELLNDLFTKPLEMLKNAGEWISQKLTGFSIAEFLENPLEGVKRGLINLILAPYHLALDAVGWIMSKLGFSELGEKLMSLDIMADVIMPIVDGIFAMVKGAGEMVSNIFSGDFDGAIRLIKNALRAILPVPDPSGNWYDPANLASKAIPKFVYDFAGIDKETGEMLELPEPEITVPDPTPIKTEIDTEQLQEDVDRNRPKVEFDTEQPIVVDGSQTEIDTPAMTNREAQQVQLDQENRQREERLAQNSGGAPIVIGGSSANVTNNNSSSSTTVGLTGTSGDPNDRYWGG